MTHLDYSVVIPTSGDRLDLLTGTLDSLAQQTQAPVAVFVVDSSDAAKARPVTDLFRGKLEVEHMVCSVRSAAQQRNLGGAKVNASLILFCDDDISFGPDFMTTLLIPFIGDPDGKIGGVAARMEGISHPVPRRLLAWYYQLQAGYNHPHYGGRLIGPAINFMPCYEQQTEPLIASEWLNSGCVLYRTEVFRRERFPLFDGYSFMEDVHLSARIGRTHQLYFHREAVFLHHGKSTARQHGHVALARMQLRNRRTVARDVMGMPCTVLGWKLFLHQLFCTLCLLRDRPSGWLAQLFGLWTA